MAYIVISGPFGNRVLKLFLQSAKNLMGGVVHYPHLPTTFSTPKLPILSLKEIAYRPRVSSIRADGSRRGSAPRGEGVEDNSQFDSRSSTSSKEEILALFKRIQSSISKGETANSKKRSSKPAEEKPSAESLLEVLRESRTQGKGKIQGRKRDKLPAPRNEPVKKEEKTEHALPVELKTTRPPSNFTKRSPITAPSILRDKFETKSEPVQVMDDNSEPQWKKFEDMKLPELKEIAKSRGIKGYSKLKKNDLVELLIKS